MLLKVINCVYCSRRGIQALYVARDNMQNNVRVHRPRVDYKQLADHNRIKSNFDCRRLKLDMNLDELCNDLKSLKKEQKTRKHTINRVVHWERMIDAETAVDAKCEQKLTDYQQRLQKARQDLRIGEDRIADYEHRLSLACLALPNDIASLTPSEDRVHLTHGRKPDADPGRCHLDYPDAIDIRDNAMIYLLGDAARFDLQFPLQCVDYFLKNDFTAIRGPDFLRTSMAEAATVALDGVFEVDDGMDDGCTNRLHLVGCGSALSYLGLLAQNFIAAGSLPMRFVTSGRAYRRPAALEPSLYNAAQSTDVSILISDTKEHIETELHNTIDLIAAIYKSLDLHYRLVYLSAPQLYPAECFAVRVEMYSPHRRRYVETGRLSHFGDFVSNRLVFQLVKARPKDTAAMPHMIGGNILNVTNVIAIMLESYGGSIPNWNDNLLFRRDGVQR